MSYLEADIEYLKRHIQTLHQFLEVINPIVDIKSENEKRPKRLVIKVDDYAGMKRTVELNPDSLDTFLIFKQASELIQVRIEQLEYILEEKEQILLKSVL